MFHNVLMTSLTPLRNTNEINHWQNRPFTAIWPEESFNTTKNTDVKRVLKKKNKRHRTNFTTEQIAALEQTFVRLRYINSEIRKQLSSSLKISERSVKIWFQNRRMKEKKEMTESSDSSADTPAELLFPRPPSSFVSSTQEIENPEPSPNQFGNSHLSGGHYQLPNYHFCHYQQYEQSSTVPSELPIEPFVDDINTYPTYYYPHMEDYYLRESCKYDSGCVKSNDVQWSANNFDLNFFQ